MVSQTAVAELFLQADSSPCPRPSSSGFRALAVGLQAQLALHPQDTTGY